MTRVYSSELTYNGVRWRLAIDYTVTSTSTTTSIAATAFLQAVWGDDRADGLYASVRGSLTGYSEQASTFQTYSYSWDGGTWKSYDSDTLTLTTRSYSRTASNQTKTLSCYFYISTSSPATGGSKSATKSVNITIPAVAAPTLGTLSHTRCNSGGTADPFGSYISLSVPYSCGTSGSVVLTAGSASSTVTASTSGTATARLNVGAVPTNSYACKAVITDSVGQKATVTATDSTAYTVPVITSMSTVRVDSSGNLDDMGEYCKVTVGWRVAKVGSQTGPTSLAIVAKQGTTTVASQTVTSFTPTASGNYATGTTQVTLSATNGFSTETSYTVTATLADSARTASVADTLTAAFYPFDVLAGGWGIGIGKPSSVSNLLDVGYKLNVDDEATIAKKLTIKADSSNFAGIVFDSAQGNYTPIRFYGGADANGDEVNIGAGGQVIVGGGESASALHTTLGVAAGTEQTYISSDNNVYLVPGCGTIENRGTANFGIANAGADTAYIYQTLNPPTQSQIRIGTSSNNGVSSSAKNVGILTFNDAAGSAAGRIYTDAQTSGAIRTIIGARNQKTDGTDVWNYIIAIQNKDGSRAYSITDGAAFRNAIGASSGTWPQSIGGTGRAMSTANRTYWCGRILYDNNTGSTGTVTLSETAANFTFMFIGYRNESSHYSGIFVRSPNGKTVYLGNAIYEASTTWGTRAGWCAISGTSITRTKNFLVWVSASSQGVGTDAKIYITHVIGFS